MPKTEQSLETRSRILEASRDLFADQGYPSTGVAEICQAAGVSKGAFYHHFGSKQAVLETIFHDWLSALAPALDVWREDPRPAPDTLRALAAAARPAFAGSDRARRLLLELWSQAARDADLAKVADAPYRHYQAALQSILDRGVRQGSLRRHDTRRGARVLISLALGSLLQSLLDRPSATSDDWGAVVADGVSMMLNGIAQES